MSQSGAYLRGSGGGVPIETITGNIGGPVGPDGADNINLVGSGSVTVTGNPGTNTLTISSSALTSISITGDTGGALTGNSFTFTGGTTGLTFNGAGTTETLGGDLVVSNGGTGATTFTTHGVLLGNGTSPISATAAGTTGQVLTGVTGSAPTFQAPAASSITITGDSGGGLTGNSFTFTGGTTGLTFAGAGSTETLGGDLVVSNGGTGRTTLTNHGVLVGAGTSAITQLAVGTNGQVLIGATGADPAFALLTSTGGSISFTTGANSLNLESVGGGTPWTDVTGTSATMVANNGYIADNAGLVTLTLPATAAQGTMIKVAGNGSGGWKIAQVAGQTIHFGSVNTTTGATGSLASTNRYDQIDLLCTVANTDFVVRAAQGNITIV